MSNKIKINPETPLVFNDPSGSRGGSSIYLDFRCSGLPNTSGRISQFYDFGTSARTATFEWRAKTKTVAAASLGNAVEIYLVTSDGTITDGNLASGDAMITSSDKRRNLTHIGSLVSDSTSQETYVNSGLCNIYSRYVGVFWYNNTGQQLTLSATDHVFVLTPSPDEIQ